MEVENYLKLAKKDDFSKCKSPKINAFLVGQQIDPSGNNKKLLFANFISINFICLIN